MGRDNICDDCYDSEFSFPHNPSWGEITWDANKVNEEFGIS